MAIRQPAPKKRPVRHCSICKGRLRARTIRSFAAPNLKRGEARITIFAKTLPVLTCPLCDEGIDKPSTWDDDLIYW